MKRTMFTESDGKQSSKRVWGSILLGSALLMSIAAGFEVYNPIENLVQTAFYAGAGLLGIGVFKKDKVET